MVLSSKYPNVNCGGRYICLIYTSSQIGLANPPTMDEIHFFVKSGIHDMWLKIIKPLTLVVPIAILTACGGTLKDSDLVVSTESCSSIDGRTYSSQKFLEGGEISFAGPDQHHWSLTFSDGAFKAEAGTSFVDGTYRCADGVYSASYDKGAGGFEFEVFDDGERISFDSIDHPEPLDYLLVDTSKSSCGSILDQLVGRTFVDPSPTQAQSLVATQLAEVFFSFSDSSQVRYNNGSSIISDGYFDCQNEVIHIHSKVGDISPMHGTLSGDKLTVTVDDKTELSLLKKEEPTVCTLEFAPVCSINFDIHCVTEPCPVGLHQTYSNQCQSDVAQALFQFAGECGDLDGKAYEPEEPIACTEEYFPVCAKEDLGIVCITAPCLSSQYTTFGNQCAATWAKAQLAYIGECGGLEEQAATNDRPAQVVAGLQVSGLIVEGKTVSLEGDLLTVSFGYSGCDEVEFNLVFSSLFLESNPVQAESALVAETPPGICAAAFSGQQTFDLAPLKQRYMDAYQADSGSIILRGLGQTYTF